MAKDGTKLCKHCKTEIPAGAKVCPNCRKKQGGVLKWIIIVVVAVLIIGAVAGGGDDSETKTAKSTKSETKQAKKKKAKAKAEETPEETPIEYMTCTVNQMMDDLDANPMNASDTYKGKYLEITGRLGNIDSNGAYITVMSDDEFSIIGVHCTLEKDNEEQRQAVSALAMDDQVTVRGKCTDVGEIMGYSLDVDSIN